jgi:hypothetical protein
MGFFGFESSNYAILGRFRHYQNSFEFKYRNFRPSQPPDILRFWSTLGFLKFNSWLKNDIESSLYALIGLQPAVDEKSNERSTKTNHQNIKKSRPYQNPKLCQGEANFEIVIAFIISSENS